MSGLLLSTEEITVYGQGKTDSLCARFSPDLKVTIELADLPLHMIAFTYRTGYKTFNTVLDKTQCHFAALFDWLEEIDCACIHELPHDICLFEGNGARDDSGIHGDHYARVADKIRRSLGYSHPQRSHRTERKRQRKYVHDAKFFPFNQIVDQSKHNEICKARRTALLRPVGNGPKIARIWNAKDAEAILESLHTVVNTIDAVYPLPDREQLAAIVRARGAVQSIAGRLTDCGLLPRLPIATWEICKPKTETEDDAIRREIEALTNGY